MSRSRKLIIAAAVAVVLLVGAGLFYLFVLRPDAEDPLELGELRDDPSATTTSAPPAPTDGTGSTPSTTTPPLDSIEGAWGIDPLSVAGYRVVEDFRGIPDFEAVGRTTEPIVGTMTIEGTTVTEASFEIDVASIESPESLRDRQFRDVMDTDQFPTATLVLTEPIDLGTVPEPETPITVTVTGDLTLRDVTLPVTFDLTAQISGATIQTLSQIPVVFSDYGIDTPSAPGITVEDDGLLEASIVFTR